jgi:hypothetical protein
MALFGKKPDPISARSKELAAQINALESQIRQLSGKIEHGPAPIAGVTNRRSSPASASAVTVQPGAAAARDPIFEPVEGRKPKAATELETSAAHYNDLGIRKFDLAGALRRFQNHFRPGSTPNPRLVSYLAAGSIRGLRPLRYEKRIARNRFIFLSLVFVLILWGIVAAFFDQT